MLAEPARREIHWKGEYREVVEPKLLVLTFSDRPEEVYELVTVVLTDLGDGWTEMLFRQRGHMAPAGYERAKAGWSSFFDRMAEHLSSV
ncbi:MAG: SRPBCC family protein [Actinomycetota bacterium]